jgi:hypothetical protein
MKMRVRFPPGIIFKTQEWKNLAFGWETTRMTETSHSFQQDLFAWLFTVFEKSGTS